MNYEKSLPLELGLRAGFSEYWQRLKIFLTVLGIASVVTAIVSGGIYLAKVHPAVVVVTAALSIATLLVLVVFRSGVIPVTATLLTELKVSAVELVVELVGQVVIMRHLLKLLVEFLMTKKDREGK